MTKIPMVRVDTTNGRILLMLSSSSESYEGLTAMAHRHRSDQTRRQSARHH